MKSIKMLVVAVCATLVSVGGFGQKKNTVVENAIASKDHTTLVAAIKAADLVTTLSAKGPFTVFAPTNNAFAKLPAGTLDNLLLPQNKAKLQSVLTYHVVAGKFGNKRIMAAIKAGKGTATFTTVQGGKLRAKIIKGKVVLMDENGNKSNVTAVDIYSSNGVVHVIDTVVMTK